MQICIRVMQILAGVRRSITTSKDSMLSWAGGRRLQVGRRSRAQLVDRHTTRLASCSGRGRGVSRCAIILIAGKL